MGHSLSSRLLRGLLFLVVGSVCLGAFVSESLAGYTEQKALLAQAGRDLRTAERLARANRQDDAAAAFGKAMQAVKKAGEGLDERLTRSHASAVRNLESLHNELSAKGVRVPALKSMEATMKAPAGPDGGGGAVGDQVSFAKEIAPMLVQFCGKCHVDGARGQFSMKNYNSLMQGKRSGRVIEVGSGAESLLVQVIAGSSMPPAGDTPTPQQTARLVRWINQGAKFDGNDATVSLRQLKPGDGEPVVPEPAAPPADEMKIPPIATPKGGETVSFSLNVAPILIDKCMSCHNAGRDRGGLDLSTFAKLWRGGDSGGIIAPKKGEASLLVHKLRGTAPEGDRMPLNQSPLSDAEITMISTWITEGAAFDGSDPSLSLARIAAVARAANSNADQLAVIRQSAADENWRLALPDERPERAKSDHLAAIGNVPQAGLAELLSVAEGELKTVQGYFGIEGEAWLKGPLTVYAFPSRIDYAEFCLMVERREADRSDRGHARYDIVEPYIAVVVDSTNREQQQVVLAEMLGRIAAAHQGQGGLPRWFVTGAGRAAAAKAHPRAELVKEWDGKTDAVIASIRNPSDILSGSLATSTGNIVAQAYITDIRNQGTRYKKIVDAVAKGKTFDEAVQAVYGIDAKKLTEAWLKSRQR